MHSLNELVEKYKLPLGLSLVGIVLIIGGIFSSNLTELPSIKPKATPKTYPKESLVDPQSSLLKIDISGAVKNPGVYSLSPNSRVVDLIKQSGGFLPDVNKDFVIKTLNLSQKLNDGMKLYIPYQGEQTVVLAVTSNNSTQNSTSVSEKIGLNSATESQLDSLPGIGPVTAKKIIGGRPYSDISELQSKKVVSNTVFGKIKDLVDLN